MSDMIPTPIIRRAILIVSLSGLIMSAALGHPNAAAGLGITGAALTADRLTAGQYDVASTSDGGKTQTVSYCFTPDQVASVNGDAKTGRDYLENAVKGAACTVKSYDVTGNVVSYAIACDKSIKTTRSTYHGESFEGDTTISYGGKTRATHTTAKRTGACQAK